MSLPSNAGKTKKALFLYFKLSYERKKYWVEYQRQELGRGGGQTWETQHLEAACNFPHSSGCSHSLQSSVSQQISATTNGGRRLRTNKSRQSRLAPYCSPSLSQFLACEFFLLCLFFIFLSCIGNRNWRHHPLRSSLHSVPLVLFPTRRAALVAKSSQITYQWNQTICPLMNLPLTKNK